MRTTVNACVVALVLLLAGASVAEATTRGIRIHTPLTTQRGVVRMVGIGGPLPPPPIVECELELTKQFIDGLVPVNPFGLTRIGRITSLRATLSSTCNPNILNMPRQLNGFPPIGPLPTSWDIGYLASDLITGDLLFGILDVQLSPFPNRDCLYRGTLLGRLRAGGPDLTLLSTPSLPLASGAATCPTALAISGTLIDNPPVLYVLLNF